MFPLFKQILLLVFLLIIAAGIHAQKKIAISKDLKQNSQTWQAKMKKMKPRSFYCFGLYQILSCEKIDSATLPKLKENFQLPPLIGPRIKTEPAKNFYRLVACYQQDTVDIRLVIFLKTITETPGIFSKKQETSGTEVDSISAVFSLRNDKAPWLLSAGSFTVNLPISGTLSRGRELYRLESINEYDERGRTMLGPFPKGVAIKTNRDTQLAAVQLRHKKYIWIKKNLPGGLFLVIASNLSLVLTYGDFNSKAK